MLWAHETQVISGLKGMREDNQDLLHSYCAVDDNESANLLRLSVFSVNQFSTQVLHPFKHALTAKESALLSVKFLSRRPRFFFACQSDENVLKKIIAHEIDSAISYGMRSPEKPVTLRTRDSMIVWNFLPLRLPQNSSMNPSKAWFR